MPPQLVTMSVYHFILSPLSILLLFLEVVLVLHETAANNYTTAISLIMDIKPKKLLQVRMVILHLDYRKTVGTQQQEIFRRSKLVLGSNIFISLASSQHSVQPSHGNTLFVCGKKGTGVTNKINDGCSPYSASEAFPNSQHVQ